MAVRTTQSRCINYVYANANPPRFVDPRVCSLLVEGSDSESTLIELQKSFVTSGFDGLKRVVRLLSNSWFQE